MENLDKRLSDKQIYKPKILTLRKKFNTLTNNFNVIKPISRNKRGLIDGIGTVIKGITGNLDDDDLLEINNHIATLNDNQKNLNSQINKQISVNEKMIQRFNNISTFINSQQENLKVYVNDLAESLTNKFNNMEFLVQPVEQYIEQLMYDIGLLNEHLNDISESIIFAKLNVISKHILHPTELDTIYDHLKKQNIEIKSGENIYEFLELHAYYNHTNIIFVIKIPTYLNQTYTFYHINSLPINNTYTLEIPSSYLLLDEYSYMHVNEPCPTIEQTLYCGKNELRNIKPIDCIPNIMLGNKAHCSLVEGDIRQNIKLIEPNHLLILTDTDVTFETTCRNNHKKKTLKGTILMHFENCSITINEINYNDKISSHWDSVKIIFTPFYELNHTNTIKRFGIEKLNNFTVENIQKIKMLTIQNEYHNTHKIIIFTALIITIIIYVAYKIIMTIKNIRSRRVKQPDTNTIEINLQGLPKAHTQQNQTIKLNQPESTNPRWTTSSHS